MSIHANNMTVTKTCSVILLLATLFHGSCIGALPKFCKGSLSLSLTLSLSLSLCLSLHNVKLLDTGQRCPDGSTIYNCIFNPCEYSSCPAFSSATCLVDYCARCNDRWVLNGEEVTDQCQGRHLFYFYSTFRSIMMLKEN